MNTNTYRKFCPNVFVAQCTDEHQKGDLILLETKYGKEVENEVHNFLGKTKDGFSCWIKFFNILCFEGLLSPLTFQEMRFMRNSGVGVCRTLST